MAEHSIAESTFVGSRMHLTRLNSEGQGFNPRHLQATFEGSRVRLPFDAFLDSNYSSVAERTRTQISLLLDLGHI